MKIPFTRLHSVSPLVETSEAAPKFGNAPMQVFYNPLFPSFRAWQLPEPPSPPGLLASLASEHQASSKEKSADKPATPSNGSIGQSPVVQAFLLRLQELGLSYLPGTDGDDALSGWSRSLADGGDSNDVIDVWSDSVVDAGAGNDSVRAWSGSVVYGGAGNDQIDVWSDSAVDAGDGDDMVRAWSNTVTMGGAGNDTISAWSDSQVDGGAGNDAISVWSNGRAYGGSGDDTISARVGGYVEGGAGDDTIDADNGTIVSGGTGDDVISADRGATVLFNVGDGKDTFFALRDVTIKLGEGLSAENMNVTMSGNRATLSFGDGSDQLTLNLTGVYPVNISFADGTSMEIKADVLSKVDLRALAGVTRLA